MASNKEFLDSSSLFEDDEPLKESIDKKEEPKDSKKNPIIENTPIIKTTPVLKMEEEEKVPYDKNRYKEPKKKNTKKRNLKQDVAVKKLISISQKNIQVIDILKKIPKDYPSDSEYICQAIIEKYQRETEMKEADIKSLVKDALEELVGEKYIIMKGSQDIQIAQNNNVNSQNNQIPSIQQESINQVISDNEKEENAQLLSAMIDEMDDDDF